MKGKLLCAAIFSVLAALQIAAQDKPKIKFGKIEASDFDLSAYKFNPEAEAVVIMDAGKTEFVVNEEQRFSLQFKKQKRVKVINKNGFAAATVEVMLYTNNGNEEKLENFRASTYNLENGNVSEVKLNWKDVFSEKINKNRVAKKFTFPALQEGSIIEYSYIIKSNYIFNLQPWEFQGEYPCLWSEYEVYIPEYFQYTNISQGYLPFTINNSQQTQQTFIFTEATTYNPNAARGSVLSNPYEKIINSGGKINLDAKININLWAMKDIPGLKLEKFISSFKNYISKIEFQLSVVKYPGQQPQLFFNSWDDVSRLLLEDEDFGVPLNRSGNWMDEEVKLMVSGETNDMDKAKKILDYLKKNFTCTGNGIYLSDNLKNTFKNKKGNVADINLLLTYILRHEKISAEPVILSTRSNGYINELYPVIERFNYVICDALIDGKRYYMDATQPKLGFGHLPLKCYNGYARVVSSESPGAIYLLADSVEESKSTTVFIINDDNNNWVGSFSSGLGYYESADVRNEISEKGTDEFFKKIKTSFPYEAGFQKMQAEPANDAEKSLTISYDFELKMNNSDSLLYFNPMLTEVLKDNPFKSAERKYPVEMPYIINEQYIANIDIPAGYEVEELPRRERIVYNDEDGMFEYIVQKNGNTIILQCRLRLAVANYTAGDYAGLRDFFGNIVKKQNELFVFRKKK